MFVNMFMVQYICNTILYIQNLINLIYIHIKKLLCCKTLCHTLTLNFAVPTFLANKFCCGRFVVKFWHIYTHIWKILSLPCVYSRDTFSVYFIFLFFITLFMQNMLAHYYKLTSHTHVSTNVPSNLSFGEFVVICKYTFCK